MFIKGAAQYTGFTHPYRNTWSVGSRMNAADLRVTTLLGNTNFFRHTPIIRSMMSRAHRLEVSSRRILKDNRSLFSPTRYGAARKYAKGDILKARGYAAFKGAAAFLPGAYALDVMMGNTDGKWYNPATAAKWAATMIPFDIGFRGMGAGWGIVKNKIGQAIGEGIKGGLHQNPHQDLVYRALSFAEKVSSRVGGVSRAFSALGTDLKNNREAFKLNRPSSFPGYVGGFMDSLRNFASNVGDHLYQTHSSITNRRATFQDGVRDSARLFAGQHGMDARGAFKDSYGKDPTLDNNFIKLINDKIKEKHGSVQNRNLITGQFQKQTVAGEEMDFFLGHGMLSYKGRDFNLSYLSAKNVTAGGLAFAAAHAPGIIRKIGLERMAQTAQMEDSYARAEFGERIRISQRGNLNSLLPNLVGRTTAGDDAYEFFKLRAIDRRVDYLMRKNANVQGYTREQAYIDAHADTGARLDAWRDGRRPGQTPVSPEDATIAAKALKRGAKDWLDRGFIKPQRDENLHYIGGKLFISKEHVDPTTGKVLRDKDGKATAYDTFRIGMMNVGGTDHHIKFNYFDRETIGNWSKGIDSSGISFNKRNNELFTEGDKDWSNPMFLGTRYMVRPKRNQKGFAGDLNRTLNLELGDKHEKTIFSSVMDTFTRFWDTTNIRVFSAKQGALWEGVKNNKIYLAPGSARQTFADQINYAKTIAGMREDFDVHLASQFDADPEVFLNAVRKIGGGTDKYITRGMTAGEIRELARETTERFTVFNREPPHQMQEVIARMNNVSDANLEGLFKPGGFSSKYEQASLAGKFNMLLAKHRLVEEAYGKHPYKTGFDPATGKPFGVEMSFVRDYADRIIQGVRDPREAQLLKGISLSRALTDIQIPVPSAYGGGLHYMQGTRGLQGQLSRMSQAWRKAKSPKEREELKNYILDINSNLLDALRLNKTDLKVDETYYGDVIQDFAENAERIMSFSRKNLAVHGKNSAEASLTMVARDTQSFGKIHDFGKLFKTVNHDDLADGMLTITTNQLRMYSSMNAINNVAHMVGLGFDQHSTPDVMSFMTKLVTKRVLPGFAMYQAYQVADAFVDDSKLFDGTALGSGLGPFFGGFVAKGHIAAQALMDATGVTSMSKYFEDLMPGSINSPLSGAVRGIGAPLGGAALGMKMGGPTGSLIGGAIGGGISLITAGGPLGLFGCLPYSQEINTDTGFRPIGTIKTGDLVYTKEGRLRKVIAVKQSEPKPVIVLDIRGVPIKSIATASHSMLVKDKDTGVIDWKGMGRVVVGDYMAFPAKRRRRREVLDLVQHMDVENYPILVKGTGSNRKLTFLKSTINKGVFSESQNAANGWSGFLSSLNAKIGLFFGWYLAEGAKMSAENHTGVSFTIDQKEIHTVLKVIHDVSQYIPIGKVTAHNDVGNTGSIDVSSNVLSQIVHGLFYLPGNKTSCHNKFIHPNLTEYESDEFYKALLAGFFDGDGSANIDEHGILKGIQINTVSRHLAWDVWKILLEFKIIASVRQHPVYMNGVRKSDTYQIAINNPEYLSRFFDLCKDYSYKMKRVKGIKIYKEASMSRTDSYFFFEGEFAFFKVKSIQERENTEPVFDLEVEEDASFIGFGCTYHNSYDITKGRDELIDEYLGYKDVAVKKGRWWELCLVKGTQVYSPDRGFVPIEDIKIGDEVVNHEGRTVQVNNLSSRTESQIVTFSPYYARVFMEKVTVEHPILVDGEEGLSWKQAGQLSTDDYLAYPILNGNLTYISLLQYMGKEPIFGETIGKKTRYTRLQSSPTHSNVYSSNHKSDLSISHNASVFLTEDFGLILGHYLGDGNVFKTDDRIRGIEFAFDIRERDKAIQVNAAMKRIFGLDTKIERVAGTNMVRLRYLNSILGTIFSTMFQDTRKIIPDWFYRVKSIRFYAGLLSGLIDSDGCIHESTRVNFVNTNLQIIHLFWISLIKLGTIGSIQLKAEEGPHNKRAYIVMLSHKGTQKLIREISFLKAERLIEVEPINYSMAEITSDKARIQDGYILLKVHGVSTSIKEQTVYDICVPDGHSFIGRAVTFHNSSQPMQGEGVSFFTKNWYAQMSAAPKNTGALYGSKFGEAWSVMGKHSVEEANMYSRPYPWSGGFGETVPLIGKTFQIGGGYTDVYTENVEYMKDPFAGYISNQDSFTPIAGSNVGFNIDSDTRNAATLSHNLAMSPSSQSTFGMDYGEIQDGMEFAAATPSDMRIRTRSAFQAVHELAGLRGWLAGGVAYQGLTGQAVPFEEVPVLQSTSEMTSVQRSFWDSEMGNMFGLGEFGRRLMQRDPGWTEKVNQISNLQPAWLPDDLRVGDAFSRVKQGEARMPGPGYEVLNNVTYDAPGYAELLGKNPEEVFAAYTGQDFPTTEDEKYAHFGRPIAAKYADMLAEQNTNAKRNVQFYNPRYDFTAKADIVMKTEEGKIPITIKMVSQATFDRLNIPRVADSAEMNGILWTSRSQTGNVIYVAPDGQTKQFSVVFDGQRAEDDLNQLRRVQEVVKDDIMKHGIRKRYNMSMSYSQADKLKILANVAPYSDEYFYALSAAKARMSLGFMTDAEKEKYFDAIDQRGQIIQKYDFYNPKFYDVGTPATVEEMQRQAEIGSKYNPVEKMIGTGWEYFTSRRMPYSTKLLHYETPVARYERTVAYGKDFKSWDNPYSSYVDPILTNTMNMTDPVEGAAGFGMIGTILGGPGMGVIGAGFGAVHAAVAGGSYGVPTRVQETRDAEWTLDQAKYQRAKVLLEQTGNTAYQKEMDQTMTAIMGKGGRAKMSDIMRALPKTEKGYFQAFSEASTVEQRERILRVVPEYVKPMLLAQWSGAAVGSDQIPDMEEFSSSDFTQELYDQNLRVDDMRLKLYRREGLDAREAGVGYAGQLHRMMRQGTAGDAISINNYSARKSTINPQQVIQSIAGVSAVVTGDPSDDTIVLTIEVF